MTIREHFEAAEAALLSEYGLDLRDAMWGERRIGGRRLRSLIRGLPPGSALHRSLDPEGSAWGNAEELLASLLEMYHASNRRKGTSPLHIPRPGEKTAKKKRRKATADEFKAFVGTSVSYEGKE